MRITLAIVASALLLLGLWLIAYGFMFAGPAVETSGSQIAATQRPTAGPIGLGLALLAGGGLFFIMLLRRP